MARAGLNCAAALSVLLLLSCGGPAEISVSDAWARETAPGQDAAALYLTLENKGAGDDRLVRASSPAAASASLHSSSSTGGIARMRPLPDGVEIPAGSSLELKPGGIHIMLTGLKRPLSAGKAIGLTLRFDRSGERTVAVQVIPAGAADVHSSHGAPM